jgi:hypothetical protein
VGKAIEGCRRWFFRGWEHDQHARTSAFCGITPPSAEDESTVLAQDLKATNSIGADPWKWLHSDPHLRADRHIVAVSSRLAILVRALANTSPYTLLLRP